MSQRKCVTQSYVCIVAKLDKHIEDLVRSCLSCESNQDSPAVALLQLWAWLVKPWQRIYVDFARPFLGKMVFLVMDVHTKWPEVFEVFLTTSSAIMRVLHHLFASYGLPCQMVSDNGPQFCSQEFATFLQGNGVRYMRCTPYHLASNGLVERFVRTFKQALKACESSGLPLQHCLASFLFVYRSTPHTTTGHLPSALFLRRELHTHLDLLKPNCEDDVITQHSNQVQHHDQHAKLRQFQVAQRVMAHNYGSGTRCIVSCCGPVMPWSSFCVGETDQSQTWKRHHDQLHFAKVAADPPSDPTDDVLVLDHPIS